MGVESKKIRVLLAVKGFTILMMAMGGEKGLERGPGYQALGTRMMGTIAVEQRSMCGKGYITVQSLFDQRSN
jgi:hypothetical protein